MAKSQIISKLILILLIIFSSIESTFSQINIGGLPYSFRNKTLNSEIPVKIMPAVNVGLLMEEDRINDNNKNEPWRFGENITVNINPENSGKWDTLSNGDKLWRVEIVCKNAVSVNLTFDKYRLPEGAKLYIYSKNKNTVLGGFTKENNQASNKFAIAPIRGDALILEYYEPKIVEFPGELNIFRVTHGYRDYNSAEKGFGSSGSCNMNVACLEDHTWDDQIKAVCMILTASNKFCTGTLINNTNEDGTPYILTAEHCYRDPSIWVFLFNWQSSKCPKPPTSPDHNDLTGAVLKAKNSDSDFCLVQINNTPPADYNVFYAGWDVTATQPEEQVCIHHPNGDIKKISFDFEPALLTDFEPAPYLQNSHWKVASWDLKTTTEAGSSGSALFSQEKYIIGQLHGGEAACGNDKSDYFGALSMSWVRGASDYLRLKDWLDPKDSGTKKMSGFDPNFIPFELDLKLMSITAPKELYYEAKTVTPSVSILNRGIRTINSFTIEYTLNGGSKQSFEWTGILERGVIINVDLPTINLSFNNYTFEVNVINPNLTPDNNPVDNSLTIGIAVIKPIFYDDFETEKGWEFSGEFELGSPKALGGTSGNPDPESAFSGTNIIGVDISGKGKNLGDYEDNISDRADYAISPAFDCSSYDAVGLYFRRWLGVEDFSFDRAYIDVDAGSGWQNVWTNSGVVNDGFWTEQLIDISDVADRKSNVRIRFSLGTTDFGQNYCGWNIDDVTIVSGVGISSIENGKKLYSVSQNNDFVNLSFNNNIHKIQVSIYDVSGRMLIQENSENVVDMNINVGSLTKGIYFLKLDFGNSVSTEKILID